MGFFSGRPRFVPDDTADERVEPEWFGPPPGVLPGYALDRAVVFRTDRAILVAGRFDVYPAGVEFTLDLRVRAADDELDDIPWELHRRRPRRSEPLAPEFLRLGVLLADGSSWRNLDGRFPRFEERPDGPVVISRGGGGGGASWTMDQWLWPLPPEGPLTFVAEWPKYEIAESRAVVDGGRIRAAAAQAEVLWSS